MNLEQLVELRRTIRVLGVDDAHYEDRAPGSKVNLTGVVCGGTQFQGMLWNSLSKDGLDATERILNMITASKFYRQLHLVLLDGITFGGFNIVDLPELQRGLNRPVVAMMRRHPDLETFFNVMKKLPDLEERARRTEAAGPIHQIEDWVFQCCGESPEVIASALPLLTNNGKVPESLRLAHMIGSAVMLGESSRRA